jgi:hypothetical protein
VEAQVSNLPPGFFTTEEFLNQFREESGCFERLFNHISLYRFFLCYCGLSLILICRPNHNHVSSYVCLGESHDLFRSLLLIMNMGAEEEERWRTQKAMDFLEMCTVSAIQSGGPVGFVVKRQKELAMAVCKSPEMVQSGLHDGAARFEFRGRFAQFSDSFHLVEAKGKPLWSEAVAAVASSVFVPAISSLSGRPTILKRFPGFLNALENVIEECGGKANARLQEMSYATGSNASMSVYKERLLLGWGIDVAASTILTYLAPRNSSFRAAQRHSPLHLMFRPVMQKKDVGSNHVDMHYCRADVKGVLSFSHSIEFSKGTITCASDVKASIFTSNSNVAPTHTLTKSWRPVDSDGEQDALHVNAHDFDKSKDTSLCANGFLFLDASEKRDVGTFSRRGQGVYTVRNVGVIPHSAAQILNDLFFGLEVAAGSAETKMQILKGEDTFTRWVEITDGGPVVNPSKPATQIGLAFFFCCFSLDILIRVTYSAQDSKMNPVERLHAALSRVFGTPILRGDGEDGLFESGKILASQMTNPGFMFAGRKVCAAAWMSDDLTGFIPPVLAEYISTRDESLIDVELELPRRLQDLIRSFNRPLPGNITIQRLLELLEPRHGGSSTTRCTIVRCGVENCLVCGGLCQRVPFPLMSNLQFPYPVPDPTNHMHYLPWTSLLSGVTADGAVDAYCFRPSYLVSAHITGSEFQPGNFRDAENRKSRLVANLCCKCRVSCRSEKSVLMLELQKQIDTHLRKQALCRNSLTTCGRCLRRVLVLDAGFCGTCQRSVCSVCYATHAAHRVDAPKLVLDNEINWKEVLASGRINGYMVTKAMLCERLKQIGQWESKFRLFNKDTLVKKLLFLQQQQNIVE